MLHPTTVLAQCEFGSLIQILPGARVRRAWRDTRTRTDVHTPRSSLCGPLTGSAAQAGVLGASNQLHLILSSPKPEINSIRTTCNAFLRHRPPSPDLPTCPQAKDRQSCPPRVISTSSSGRNLSTDVVHDRITPFLGLELPAYPSPSYTPPTSILLSFVSQRQPSFISRAGLRILRC